MISLSAYPKFKKTKKSRAKKVAVKVPRWVVNGGPLLGQGVIKGDAVSSWCSDYSFQRSVNRDEMKQPPAKHCKLSRRNLHALSLFEPGLREAAVFAANLKDAMLRYQGDVGVERPLQDLWHDYNLCWLPEVLVKLSSASSGETQHATQAGPSGFPLFGDGNVSTFRAQQMNPDTAIRQKSVFGYAG